MAGEAIILASAARTASVDSDDIFQSTATQAHIIINVSAVTATPSVVFTLQGKGPLGTYYDLLVSPAITATGVTVLKIGPGLAAVPNASAADFLPGAYRVKAVHGDADSITYSVTAVYGE